MRDLIEAGADVYIIASDTEDRRGQQTLLHEAASEDLERWPNCATMDNRALSSAITLLVVFDRKYTGGDQSIEATQTLRSGKISTSCRKSSQVVKRRHRSSSNNT